MTSAFLLLSEIIYIIIIYDILWLQYFFCFVNKFCLWYCPVLSSSFKILQKMSPNWSKYHTYGQIHDIVTNNHTNKYTHFVIIYYNGCQNFEHLNWSVTCTYERNLKSVKRAMKHSTNQHTNHNVMLYWSNVKKSLNSDNSVKITKTYNMLPCDNTHDFVLILLGILIWYITHNMYNNVVALLFVIYNTLRIILRPVKLYIIRFTK